MSLIFSTSTVFIARRITAFISFFLGGWVGGGGEVSWLFFWCSCYLFHFQGIFLLVNIQMIC